MDENSLKQALSGLTIGPTHYFESLGSTNDEAARWAEDGASDLALVVADEQTAGRGRLDRRWYTPPGSALAFSVVLQVGQNVILNYVPRLTALGALATCQALRQGYGLPAQVKWPNDVLVEGCKLAGVLVEAAWQGERLKTAILGIGINVAPASIPPDLDLNFPATCVETALGRPVERLELLRSILGWLVEWRPRLNSPDFLRAWEDVLAFRGEWVRVIWPGRPTLEGQVLGLDYNGSLRLKERSGQVHSLQYGEVRLRPVDSR
jgi:BirA family biotin operon repressor/biotin-[acetyl-CoA-carboxylase] ligase